MLVVMCSLCSWQEECKTPCYEAPKKEKTNEKETENFEEIFKKELTKLEE